MHITAPDDFDNVPNRPGLLYEAAFERQGSIHAAIASSVADHLGPEFQVAPLTVRPGSVEILAPILALGAGVASYGAIRQGMQFVRDDLRLAMGKIFPRSLRMQMQVSSYWQLAPELPLGETQKVGSSALVATPQGLLVYCVAIISLVIMAILASLLGVVFVKVL